MPDTWGITKRRASQKVFREKVLENFGGVCCVCELDEEAILEASHIRPWNVDKENRLNPSNGVSLCRNHHKLYDDGYFKIDKESIIRIDIKKIEKAKPKISEYLKRFDGKKIINPKKWKLLL